MHSYWSRSLRGTRVPRVFAATLFALVLTLDLGTEPFAARIHDSLRFGRSVRGTALRAENLGAKQASTKVLLVGCIHGNECAGRRILKVLRGKPSPSSFELWTVRDANPDGSRARTRQNARGVDLNRNFGAGWRGGGEPWDTYYPGPGPFSEPETRAVRRLIRKLRPDITIWYHQRMALVAKTRRHVRVQRQYADIVNLPLTRLEALPGTASRWQNRSYPRHLSFVVELPAGPMSSRAAHRHARAVAVVAKSWGRLR